MAIINCPECGKEISDKAEKCIHCGFPLFKWYKITLTGYNKPETFASEGLKQVLHLNYDYDILSNILSNCPYEIGKFNSEKEALECAQQLKKWDLNFYVEDSQGNIIESDHINPASQTYTTKKTLSFWDIVWAIIVAVIIISLFIIIFSLIII